MDSLGYEYGDSRNGDHGGGINKMGDTSSPGEGRIFNDEKLISKATTIVSLTHDSKHMVWNGKKKQQWPYGTFSKNCRCPILLEFVIISNRPGNRDKA